MTAPPLPEGVDGRAKNGEPRPETGSKVVLTIAHMDHDESHADPERCRALCQRCHNQWDAQHRKRERRQNPASEITTTRLDRPVSPHPN